MELVNLNGKFVALVVYILYQYGKCVASLMLLFITVTHN
jgi:hypothetical protein